jgi:hypothetical protein
LKGFVIAALLALTAVTEDATLVPGFFDLAVPGGVATYEALGLAPEERGTALALLVRQIYSQGAAPSDRGMGLRLLASSPADAAAGAPRPVEASAFTIAAPLTADHWRDLLAIAPRAEVFPALLANRSVLLVCAGALSTDQSVRMLLERDRGLLRWLARSAPGGFWVAARSLRIADGRVMVPGGADAEPIWEAIVEETVARPADFIRAIASRDGGRLAWFYDSVAAMSADRRAAAFGPGPAVGQIERARALYSAFRGNDSNWRLEEHPFLRTVSDAWVVSSQVAVRDGAVAGPAWAWLWKEVFDRPDIPRRAATGLRREPGPAVTLSWLARSIAGSPPRERRDRYEMVRFAQLVFGDAGDAEAVDVTIALGGYRRYRALLLTLDRMGVTAPRTYARAVDAARRLDSRPGREAQDAVIALQAALAIVERARMMRTIDLATAEHLVLSLADAVDRDAPVAPAVAQWITTTLSDSLPLLRRPDQWTGKTAYESKILQAMSGPPAETGLPRVEWEGLTYRVDLHAAEVDRLRRIREQLASPGLDAALDSADPRQLSRALMAIVYAPALGDPDGQALLGADIMTRHDFGFRAPAGVRRERLPWSLPREHVGDGAPWRVEGALLGLDVALARLMLRRLADNEMPMAPSINLNDQMTVARTIPAMTARDLRDADRDRLVQAIARGRQRVAAAGADFAAVRALAAEARLSAGVQQTLRWTIARSREAVPALFGLRDLMWLGRPELSQPVLDTWGVYVEGLEGRMRTAMPPSAAWEDFGGRADAGFIGTQTPDLTLRLAEETARLRLPARLIPALLAFAAQDYWHDVAARFPDDWPAMARQALALSPQRVEDYVAALTGNGPLRPQ